MATYDYWNGTAWVQIPKVQSDPSAPSATNLVADPYFANLADWTFAGTAANNISLLQSPPTDTPSWVITANGAACSISDSNTDLGKLSKIVPLATYRFTAWIKSTITRTGAASGITINGDWIKSDGTILGTHWSYPVATVAGTWVQVEFIVDAPSTATYVTFALSLGTSVPSGTVIAFSYPCIQPMITADLIADGAVGSNELATNAVIASKIFAGAVTAGKIDTNAIVAENIQAGAVIADKIATGAVIADKIDAGAVTATKVAADAITATKIAAGTISTSHIAPAGISGTVIVDGTLAANKLIANSLTIGQMASTIGTDIDIAANATITGMTFGGRNLMDRTDTLAYGIGNFVANTSAITVDTSVTYLGGQTIKCDMASTNTGIVYANFIQLRANTTYTYSMMMRSTQALTFTNSVPLGMVTQVDDSTPANLETIINHSSSIAANTWTKVYVTFSTPNAQPSYYWRPRIGGGFAAGAGVYVNVCNVQCEEGNKSSDWSPSINDEKASIQAVQTLIDAAASAIGTINASISDLTSDSKLSPVEKSALQAQWQLITSEVAANDTLANTWTVTTEKTAYDSAFASLNTYITPLIADTTTTSDIVSATFKANFSDFYSKRNTLLQAISTKSAISGTLPTVTSTLATQTSAYQIGTPVPPASGGYVNINGGVITVAADPSGTNKLVLQGTKLSFYGGTAEVAYIGGNSSNPDEYQKMMIPRVKVNTDLQIGQHMFTPYSADPTIMLVKWVG